MIDFICAASLFFYQKAPAVNIGDLLFGIKGDASGAVAAFKQSTDAAKSYAVSLSNASKSTSSFSSDLTKFVTLPLIGVGAALIKVGSVFDDSFDRIRIGTGKVGPALESLKESFRNVVAEVPASFEKASEAITMLAQRTTAAGDTLEGLAKQELELARITGSDLKAQIEATTQAFDNYGIGAEQQGDKLDFLFRVSQQTGIGVTQLAQQMAQSGGIAKSAGLSFETTASLVGQLSKAGIDASTVMGGFQKALSAIAKKSPGTDPAEAIQNIVAAIKSAGSEAKQNSVAVEYFGRSGIQMAAAIRGGKLDIEGLTKALANNKDTILGAGKDTADFAEGFQHLKNKIMLAVEPLAGDLFNAVGGLVPIFEGLVKKITEAVKWFNDLSPTTKDIAVKLGLVLIAAGPVITIIGKLTTAVTGTYNAFVSVVGYVPTVIGQLKAMDAAVLTSAATWRALGASMGPLAGKAGLAGVMSQVDSSDMEDAVRNDFGLANVKKAADMGGGMGRAFLDAWANVITDKPKPPGKPPDFGGHGKKLGGAAGKGLIDGFTEGSAGVDAALKHVASAGDLFKLFDPMSKVVKAGAEKTVSALKSVASGINEFFQATGNNAKVNIAELASNWDKYNAVIGKTDAYEHLKDALNSVNLDRVVAGFVTFDDTLKISGNQIEISELAFQALKAQFPQIVSEVAKAGLKFHEVFPAIGAEFVGLEKYTDASLRQMDDWADGFEKSQFQATDAMRQTMEEAPHWAGAIVDASERIKDALKDQSGELLRVRAALDIRASIDSVIGDFERFGQQIGLTGQKLEDFVENKTRTELGKFKDITQTEINAAIEAHKLAAIQLPGIWGPIFDKLGSQAKAWAGSVFGVLDTIPGAFGSTVKKVTDTINQWGAFFNQILGLLHKFVAAVPDSIGSALQQVVGLIKGTQSTLTSLPVIANKPGYLDPIGLIPDLSKAASGAKSATGNITTSVTKMSDTAKGAFAAAAGAAAGFATSMSVMAAGGSRSMAIVSGAITSALAGFMASVATTGPIGAIVGGISFVGSILGAIFGGPSKAEKARIEQQKQLALQQTQQQVLQAFEATKQALLTTVSQARDLLESLRFYDRVGSPAIKAFFKDLSKFFTLLVAESRNWTALASVNLKTASENLSAGVDLIGKLPAVLASIGTYFKVGDAQMAVFFADADVFFIHLAAFVADIPRKAQKAIGQFGDRTSAGINVLSPLIAAIRAMVDLPDVPDVSFDRIQSALQRIVDRIGGLAAYFAKSWLKSIAFFSENVSPGVEVWKNTIDTIKSMVDVPVPSEGDFDSLFDSLKAGVTRMVAFAAELTSEGLSKAAAVAGAVLPIAAAIKAWMEVSGLVRGYTAIAKESWQAAVDDFAKGLSWLSSLIDQALDYLDLATKFNDTVALGNVQLNAGITGFVGGVNGAFGALNAAFNSIHGGEVFDNTGADAAARSATSGIAASAASSPHGAQSSRSVLELHVHYHGDVIHESKAGDYIIAKLVQAQRRGQLKLEIV